MRRNQEIEFIPLQSIFATLQGSHQSFQARGCFWSIYRGIDSFAFHFQFQQDHNHWLKYKTKRSPLSTVKFCPPLQRRLELWEKFGASSSQHILHMLLLFQQPLMPSTNSTQHKVFSKEQMVKHSRLHTVEYSAHYTAHTQYVHTSINSINAIDSGQ